MSVERCKYCEEYYDQDFNSEHEDECRLEHTDSFELTVKVLENIPRKKQEEVAKILGDIKDVSYNDGFNTATRLIQKFYGNK